MAISDRILAKICDKKEKKRFWITDDYSPLSHTSFENICHALVKEENVVLTGYLHDSLDQLDETGIIIGMVLTKDIQYMMAEFDRIYESHDCNTFKNARKQQRSPFEHMLRIWVRQNREPIEKEELNQDVVAKDANALKEEQDKGGWYENRDQLESILMKKSIKYARAVIQEFEKANANVAIEDMITGNVQRYYLNHDLADAYSSLARYIKNKYKYIADLLFKYSDGSDKWGAWSMCIAVLHPQEWPKVNEVFKKDHSNYSLSTFILQRIPDDLILAEMIAVIVDPTFKPTTFSKKQA